MQHDKGCKTLQRDVLIDAALKQRLRNANNVVVFTGAGMSAESGIPTFRDRFDGLWAKYDPMDVATPHAFKRDPQFVWDWHVYLGDAVRAAKPNAGHNAVAQLQNHVQHVTVITQNIDNLHQTAGSRDVVELHGNLLRLKAFVDVDELFQSEAGPIICRACDGYAVNDEYDPYASKDDLEEITLQAGPVPRCPACGTLLRPDVVWFGEPLEPDVLDSAFRAVDTCDVLFCIGSSLEVEPAAGMPWRALRRGAIVIEINPESTLLSAQAHATFNTGAAMTMPKLLANVWGIDQ
jgi:NAD-dependent deacetylase